MMGLKLKVKRLSSVAVLPSYSHQGDAGLDLCAAEALDIAPGKRCLVRTGISIELPIGTEAQIRPRSGLALKYGLTVLNAPGTIDQGYRGEIRVILINHGDTLFRVTIGSCIAQLVIHSVLTVALEESATLSETARGAGGFGSTGLQRKSG